MRSILHTFSPQRRAGTGPSRVGCPSAINVRGLVLVFILGGITGCNGAEPVEEANPPSASTGGALSFYDVTAEAGLSAFRHENGAYGTKWFPEAMGSGGGFLDYDGDGWLDVLLVGGGTWPDSDREPVRALWLYRNNGDGTFADVTDDAGLGDVRAYGFGITVADYDNDGDQDVYFTTLDENMLFQNEDGTFIEVGAEAGVTGGSTWSTSPIFFDADRDGLVDLYVGSYVEWSPETDLVCTVKGGIRSYCTPEHYRGVPSLFYRNNGDGTFTDRTAAAGFADGPGKMLGVAELDYNDDDWPDLVVASDTQRDLLYENNRDGTFTEKGAISGVAYDENGSARAGMGIDAGVVDSTGEETMFVGNFSKEMIGVYRHLGNGLFIDRAGASKIGLPSLLTLTFGLFLFDVDLDGDLDLFTANGHVQPEIEETQEGITYREPPHLFINDGEGTFEDAGAMAGPPMQQPLVARGAAYGDYDRDGDLDVLVTENGGPVHLWRNDLTGSGHFLRVRVEGRESNRDGLGTKMTAFVGGRSMERRVRTGSSFMSQLEKTVTFGLGDAAAVDSLVIRWPSGHVDRFTELTVDREYTLVEGEGRLRMLEGKKIAAQF